MKPGTDYIGVSAGAVIIRDDGKIFMAKRSSGARDDHGKWEFPGGSLEFHETREEAVERLMWRKYCLRVDIVSVLGVYDVIDKENKDHWLSTTYLCRFKGGEPKIMEPEKCELIRWFTKEEIKKLDVSRITQLNLNDLK